MEQLPPKLLTINVKDNPPCVLKIRAPHGSVW